MITVADFIDACNQVAPDCECGHPSSDHAIEVEWFDGRTGSARWDYCNRDECLCLRYTLPEKVK